MRHRWRGLVQERVETKVGLRVAGGARRKCALCDRVFLCDGLVHGGGVVQKEGGGVNGRVQCGGRKGGEGETERVRVVCVGGGSGEEVGLCVCVEGRRARVV